MIVYGAGGHGKVLHDIALCSNEDDVIKFADDSDVRSFAGVDVISPSDIPSTETIIIAVGDNKVRNRIAESLLNHEFKTLIHPKSCVSRSVKMGEGTAVMAGSVINAGATVGKHVILNTNCSVDHDCIICDFVHISPNAALAGNVNIGEGTHVGISATIIQGLNIGKWVTIGAGAVVIRDVPDYAVVVGNPGKIIKYNTILKNE